MTVLVKKEKKSYFEGLGIYNRQWFSETYPVTSLGALLTVMVLLRWSGNVKFRFLYKIANKD